MSDLDSGTDAQSEAARLISSVPRAPRAYPEALSGRAVRAFAVPVVIGMLAAALLAGIGYYFEDGYREYQEMRYYGDFVQGVAGNPLSDEEGDWADVAYEYGGEVQTAKEIDITGDMANEIRASPDGMIELALVVWPEEPKDPVAVRWIDDQTAWFMPIYVVAIIAVVLGFLIGLARLLKTRSRFTNGEVVWGEPLGGVAFDAEARRFRAQLVWRDGASVERSGFVSWGADADPVRAPGSSGLMIVASGNVAEVVTHELLQALKES